MSVGSRIPKESPLINQAYISSDWDDVMVRKTIRNPHTAGLNLQRVIIIAAMFKKESDVEGAQSARHVRSRAEPQQPQWQKQAKTVCHLKLNSPRCSRTSLKAGQRSAVAFGDRNTNMVFSDSVTDKRWLEQQSTAATVPSKLRSN